MKLGIDRKVGITIAAIGAIGEAILLFHWLVNWYPFKSMTYPSAAFYTGIAYAGFVLGPVIAIGAVCRLSRYGISYVPAVAVVICPTVFWIIFVIASSVYRIDDALAALSNYDHTTHAQVQAEFLQDICRLIVTGAVIGTVCGMLAKVTLSITGHLAHSRTGRG